MKKFLQHNMKVSIYVACLLSVFISITGESWGQVTIYSQNFGTGTSFPTGWSTSGLSPWTISTSNASSGYTDASGGSNLSSGSSSSARTVTVAGVISTVNCTNVSIIWGARRTYSNNVTCEWSTDGSTWNSLTFTDVANNSTWALVNGGTRISLPAGANGAANLRIRWTYDSDGTAGRYRIDDFNVVATPLYAAQFVSMDAGLLTWCAGETRTVSVTVKNIGSATWTNSSPDVNIGVKWNTNGSNWADYYVRANADNLAPGATATYSLTITASNNAGAGYTTPLANGTNNLTFDVVKEGDCWFGNNSGSCGPGNTVYTSSNITIINSVPAQPSVISGSASPCVGTSQTYSVTNVAGVTYNWAFPAGWTQTAGGTTNSVTVTVGAASGNVTVTPSNACGNGTARTFAVNPVPVPAQPSDITGNATPCLNSSQTYSVTNVPGVTYNWSFPSGWTQTAGGTTNSVTVNVGAASGDISVTPSNGCGNGTARTLPVSSITIPSQPSVISGNSSPCQGSSQIYSVTNVTDVIYTWSFPAGWTITAGQGTNSVTVTVGSNAGNITVTPSNVCGNGTVRTLAVTTTTTPAQPGVITGNTTVCRLTSLNYSVPVISGVTYTWTVPTGASITSGQGTNSITVSYGSSAMSGLIQVTPSNTCGDGPVRSLSVTVNASVPARPGTITGVVAPCQGSVQTYSVAAVPTAMYYTWTVPSDWTINSGQNTNSITVTVGAQSGNITVNASNSCGTGNTRTLEVFPASVIPAQPQPVNGNTAVCVGSEQDYSVNNVSHVTYSWTVPADWTINSGQGTNAINVTAGSTPGNIIVVPSNNCGTGTSRSLSVSVDVAAPAQPDIIAGNLNPCEASVQTYSVTGITGVSYAWTVPADWNITSGQGTNSISVTIGPTSGDVVVTASNACGIAADKSISIVVDPLPAPPSAISGGNEYCEGSSVWYYITEVPGLSYNWNVPSGWVISSGQGTDSIRVTIGANSGNVQVIPVNACGNGQAAVLYVNVNRKPNAETGDDKGICIGASIRIGAAAVAGNTYSWTSYPAGFTSSDANPLVQPDTTTKYYLTETVTATGCTNSDSVTVTAVQVITVNYTPSSSEICSGSMTNIALSSNITGTTFAWDAALTSGTNTTGFSNGTGTPIRQTITNTSGAASTVTYSVTATADVCVNTLTSIDVVINPAPVVTSQTNTLCSHIASGLTLGASTNGVAAATYNITAINRNGLTAVAGNPVTGNGFSNIVIADDAWSNTTTNPVNVIYTVVPVSALGCPGASFTVTLTVNPKPAVTNASSKSICSGTGTNIALTANITSTFSWTIGTITGGITGASAGSGSTINQVLTNPGNTSPGTVQYIVTPTSVAGTCAGDPFTITVTVNPIPAVTNATTKSICSVTGTSINLTATTPSTFAWTLGTITGGITGSSAGSGATINQTLINPSNTTAGTVPYIITPTSTAGACAGSSTTITVTVNPLPTVTAGSSVNDVCPGDPFSLSSASNIYFPPVLLSENFNQGTNNWTKNNTASGGTPANVAWTLRPDGYVTNSETFNSNDASQFYLSDSYSQNGNSNTTTLMSPAINTIGYSTLTLDFWHYYNYNARTNEAARVQVSTDGTNWTNIATYTSDQGSAANFAHPSLPLNAYVGNATLYIRFYYYCGSNRGRYWAIDNVTLTGTSTAPVPNISWSSNPAGFTSAVANPANVTQAVNTVYNVTYTNTVTGCSNSASKTVNTLPLPVPTITADYCAVQGAIRLTGGGGGTYLWSTGSAASYIDVDVAGVYGVTVTNASGCRAPQYLDVSNELVVDGSFTNFNPASPSFVTGYNQHQSYYNPSAPNPQLTGLWPEGDYAVNVSAWYNPTTSTGYHPDFHGRDHTNNTSGPRNFLMINGSTATPLRTIWQQTVTVLPNTDYYFSAWAMNLNPASPARLQFEVNGALVGTVADLNIAPKPTTEGQVALTNWVRFYSNPKWNSGSATTAVIRIVNLNTVAGGNDFGLDDISFGTLAPIPFTINPASGGNICAGQTLNLYTNITGGRAPIVYSWTGPNGFTSNQPNPVISNATVANSGTYTLTVRDGYGCTPVVETVDVVVNPMPAATVSGTTQVCQYANQPLITFTGTTGTAPFTFVYKVNSNPNDTITTTSGNSITVPASTLMPGTYVYSLVSVSDVNGCGKSQSGSATVTVRSLPVVSIDGNSPVCTNSSNTYTTTAGMSSYSWSISGNGSIVGATNTSSINVSAGSVYGTSFTLNLNVTDSYGCSGINEEEFFIQDNTLPTITVPSNQTKNVNINSCSYTTVGTEFNPTNFSDNCQVASVVNNINGTNTLAGYVFPLGTTSVTWTVTDAAGNSANRSFNVTVRDNQLPVVSCPPANAVVCANNGNKYSNTTNAWNATATDNCTLASLTYTLSGATTGTGTNLNGVTFNAGVTTVNWRATDAAGNFANCAYTFTVQTPPVISTQPQNRMICPASQATFNVSISNASPVPSYQWRKNGVDIPGATGTSYTILSTQPSDLGDYDVIINNSCGTSSSGVASLTFPAPLTASIDTAGIVANRGYNPDPINLITSKAGGMAPFTYQWQLNNVNIPGATGLSYDPPSLTVVGVYRYKCTVCDACGSCFTTLEKKITIESPLPIELAYFTADCNDGTVEFNWATLSEINNDFFTIESSYDNESWNILNTVDGAGYSNSLIKYKLTSEFIMPAYFRLLQTDFDGTSEYFQPVYVDCNETAEDKIIVYNSADISGTIAYSIESAIDADYCLVVYDIMGKKMIAKNIACTSGNNFSSIDIPNLVNGLYIVSFKNLTTQKNYNIKVHVN